MMVLLPHSKEVLIKHNRKLFKLNEEQQTLDFASSSLARLRWCAIPCGFISIDLRSDQ